MKTTTISQLPKDMVEEILCRVPMKSVGAVQSTCQNWNLVSKDGFFIKKHIAQLASRGEKESVMLEYWAELIDPDLYDYFQYLTLDTLVHSRYDFTESTYDELHSLLRDGGILTLPKPKRKMIDIDNKFVMATKNDFRVHLFRTNLKETEDKKFDLSVNHEGTLGTGDNSGHFLSIGEVCHSNGLLLCIPKDTDDMLAVCNPYLHKRKLIKCPKYRIYDDMFALGFDKSSSCESYKILMASYQSGLGTFEYQIWSSYCDSWKSGINDTPGGLDVNPRGGEFVSLKGDVYFYDKDDESQVFDLACFDFTTERFTRLPMPHNRFPFDASLSSVREEQLGLLVQWEYTLQTEVWVTNQIEPDAVLWTHLFTFDIERLQISTYMYSASRPFFILEEKKIVVLLGDKWMMFEIIGERHYYKTQNRGSRRIYVQAMYKQYLNDE